ncbi:MAG: hypothetical protein K2F91_07085 [Muribaculaceae bacterium]|nr:hypothetical protein [Muribaculaceae bacterium]MDE6197612.1 hypothetical protein [Muribaculaceae bacterium]
MCASPLFLCAFPKLKKDGRKVAELDKKDYALGVEAAQAQYDQMVAETARLRKLYEAQSVSKNDLDKAEISPPLF